MDDLTELHDSLRGLVARPGTFEALFPETSADHLTALLLDALAEVQLEGLLLNVDHDGDGMLEPEITSAQGALITLYAGSRLLRAELLNRVMHRRYEAGTAVFEEDYNVTLYSAILKDLQAQKDRLTADQVGEAAVYGVFEMADQYVHRAQPWRHIGTPHPANVW